MADERRRHTVYPPEDEVFAALHLTPLASVRVVILGQDPYHGPRQAHGLCFSVPDGVPFPPSLANVFRELHDDLDVPVPTSGDLTPWARQGVLLLNATLTVRARAAASHQGHGWERFTEQVVRAVGRPPRTGRVPVVGRVRATHRAAGGPQPPRPSSSHRTRRRSPRTAASSGAARSPGPTQRSARRTAGRSTGGCRERSGCGPLTRSALRRSAFRRPAWSSS